MIKIKKFLHTRCFILNTNFGFTLVELLVTVGIVALVGTMVSNLFLSNLRTAAKTKALTEVKQNGDYALGVMSRMIINTKEVQENSDGEICEAGMSKLKILNPDGETTEFMCGGQIASNSGTFLTASKLEISDCSFVCEKPEGKPAVVTINFTLAQGGASLGKEFTAEASFKTTVSTRTY